MSERLAPTDSEPDISEDTEREDWPAAEPYALMKVDAGEIGDNFYYSLPTFTVLVKTKDDLDALNEEFSALFSKYTEQIIVGDPNVATLIISLNQAAAELAAQNNVIEFLRGRLKELNEEAGDWEAHTP